MIDRYARPEMQAIWSEEGRYRRWLEVEFAVAQRDALARAHAQGPLVRGCLRAGAAPRDGHTWDRGGDYRARVLADARIGEVLSKEEVERVFRLEQALRHVDAIFERTLDQEELA